MYYYYWPPHPVHGDCAEALDREANNDVGANATIRGRIPPPAAIGDGLPNDATGRGPSNWREWLREFGHHVAEVKPEPSPRDFGSQPHTPVVKTILPSASAVLLVGEAVV